MIWWRHYSTTKAKDDAVASVIVTVMLIPQSLAYALLAGLPAQVGLYASIFPLVAYALIGSSSTLAVGPVAVVSLMTAAAVGAVAPAGSDQYLAAAILLALMSGVFLIGLGLLRAGFLANLLSHPVISGFISASAVLIAISQLKHVLGIQASGHTLLELGQSLLAGADQINPTALIIGLITAGFLFWSRSNLGRWLLNRGVANSHALLIARLAPMLAIILTTASAALFSLSLPTVGWVPAGLPSPAWPTLDLGLARELIAPAILISLVGFVESVSVGHTLAAKRRERIQPTRELFGLGAANIASGMGGGFPVTGGFSRSVVNFDAGAATPMAGVFTAVLIAVTALFLTDLFFFLPNAVLGATVIVAVLSLVEVRGLKALFQFSRSDFAAWLITVLVVLGAGVELGIIAGIACSVACLLIKIARPHIAELGRIEGTEHFRNLRRHSVECDQRLASLRFDARLHFLNAHHLESKISELTARPALKHIIVQCNSINGIDATGLESLETINRRLIDSGIGFHLSEVKGPVMDDLDRSDFLQHLNGQVFLSHHQAVTDLESSG